VRKENIEGATFDETKIYSSQSTPRLVPRRQERAFTEGVRERNQVGRVW